MVLDSVPLYVYTIIVRVHRWGFLLDSYLTYKFGGIVLGHLDSQPQEFVFLSLILTQVSVLDQPVPWTSSGYIVDPSPSVTQNDDSRTQVFVVCNSQLLMLFLLLTIHTL